MNIKGSLPEYVRSGNSSAEGVKIRLDSYNDMAFWLEIHITKQELQAMLLEVEIISAGAATTSESKVQ